MRSTPGTGSSRKTRNLLRPALMQASPFIGPNPGAIKEMGLKIEARRKMAEAGVPIIPGTPALQSEDDAVAAAEKIGLPDNPEGIGRRRRTRLARVLECGQIRRMLPWL